MLYGEEVDRTIFAVTLPHLVIANPSNNLQHGSKMRQINIQLHSKVNLALEIASLEEDEIDSSKNRNEN